MSGTELEAVDIAVIGSGIAGLFLAVECARSGLTVAVVTKKEVTASSTNWAQGGIAGVLDPDDSEAIESDIVDYFSLLAAKTGTKIDIDAEKKLFKYNCFSIFFSKLK